MLRILLPLIFLSLPATAESIAPDAIEVIDGDTIRAPGVVFRLVGLGAPETGSRAHCEAERAKGGATQGPLDPGEAPRT
jgi:endonuclease YncB( thermonuclease family)